MACSVVDGSRSSELGDAIPGIPVDMILSPSGTGFFMRRGGLTACTLFAASFAIWDQFKNLIFIALTYLYSLTGDWGVAIILLTVAIRILILPLTIKQTASMYEMQKIQPKIKALQAKYKDDKEKLQEETLKFYSENKVNPLGGCLPLLLQMPVFFALFQVLRTQLPEGASFLGIIPNLGLTPIRGLLGRGQLRASSPASSPLSPTSFWSCCSRSASGFPRHSCPETSSRR